MKKVVTVLIFAMLFIITSCAYADTNEAISIAEIPGEQVYNETISIVDEETDDQAGSESPTPEISGSTDLYSSPSPEISAMSAIPSMLSLYVNETPITMPSFYVEGQYYFYFRDIAYVLNDTIARFCLDLHDSFDALAHRGRQYTPVGTELRLLPEVEEVATHRRAFVNDQLWLTGGFFGINEAVDAMSIDNRFYVDLLTMGQIFGFDSHWNASTETFHIDTNEPSITAYGQQVAEDFLSQFVTLHYRPQRVHEEDHYTLVDRETGIEIDDVPESFYYCEDERTFVHSYFLYDLNNDGIPEIVVQWGRDVSRWNDQTLYVYKDGGYEAAGDISLHIFYSCEQGELFLYSGDLGRYSGTHGRFYSVVMTENEFQRELLFGEYWDELERHISGSMAEVLGEVGSLNDRPRFPIASHPHRTDEPLLPLRPFTMYDIR